MFLFPFVQKNGKLKWTSPLALREARELGTSHRMAPAVDDSEVMKDIENKDAMLTPGIETRITAVFNN